jgi:hypothetical protein
MATCVRPAARSQSAKRSSSWVVVPNVLRTSQSQRPGSDFGDVVPLS